MDGGRRPRPARGSLDRRPGRWSNKTWTKYTALGNTAGDGLETAGSWWKGRPTGCARAMRFGRRTWAVARGDEGGCEAVPATANVGESARTALPGEGTLGGAPGVTPPSPTAGAGFTAEGAGGVHPVLARVPRPPGCGAGPAPFTPEGERGSRARWRPGPTDHGTPSSVSGTGSPHGARHRDAPRATPLAGGRERGRADGVDLHPLLGRAQPRPRRVGGARGRGARRGDPGAGPRPCRAATAAS